MVREIKIDHICKIEGHANLRLKIDRGKVTECYLEANEGARFFEALTIGKKIIDIQEIVSRICGICSAAHGIAAINALEKAMQIKTTEREEIIRELLLIGERIRSHATHIYFLVYPDYLRCSALTLAQKQKQKIDDALALIKFGNKIVEKIGGREMHPFIHFNTKEIEAEDILNETKKIKETAKKTIDLFASIDYPTFKRKTNFLCLRDDSEYSFFTGKIITENRVIEAEEYDKHIRENIKEYATSKFVLFDNSPYLTGAIVRLKINNDKLDDETKKIFNNIKRKIDFDNPFHNTIAQAIEIHFCINRAESLLKKLEKMPPVKKEKELKIKKGKGISAVEAPRGTLFHEYSINEEGIIEYCNIITPTAQNLNQIEKEIANYTQEILPKKIPRERIVLEIEKLIRSFDPCFSCSTHFLNVDWQESD